ncbi:MAG: Crp/Fnr family transcriptional regulator [Magnetococcales bacterium]|nr:Crp/Fnr family transcriptional regulator [Magnetococcales bacterium]MBF0113787.1 Crp/Fnr family transcriptional regulator [Magnetococcales bacterium]
MLPISHPADSAFARSNFPPWNAAPTPNEHRTSAPFGGLESGTMRQLRPGEKLFSVGDEVNEIHWLSDGRIALAAAAANHQTQQTITIVHGGCLLENRLPLQTTPLLHQRSATALSRCRLIVFDKYQLMTAIDQTPLLIRLLMAHWQGELETKENEIKRKIDNKRCTACRLMRLLLERVPAQNFHATRLWQLGLSNGEMAQLLEMHHATLSRTLAGLIREEILLPDQGKRRCLLINVSAAEMQQRVLHCPLCARRQAQV